ncbi:MAG: Rv2175c family DNA-binding protein [Geodermatophilaceae bacterium]
MDLLTLPEVATRLGIRVNRVRQLIRDRVLATVDRDGLLGVPADFFDDEGILTHLHGVLTVLRDGGYTDAEAVSWLFTEDESLPGTPIAALHDKRHHEVNRRAQTMAF